MKRLISVLLIVSLVLLNGCAAMFLPKSGLVEITGIDAKTQYVFAAALGEKYWVLLGSVFIPAQQAETEAPASEESTVASEDISEAQEQDAEDIAYEEQGDAADEGEFYYQLSLVNPDTAKVVKTAAIKDCPVQDLTGVHCEKDGTITVFNEFDKVGVKYSSRLKQLGEKFTYESKDVDALAKKNPLIDDSFSHYDSFASDYMEFVKEKRVNCYAFYGEDDAIYFADNERFSPQCGFGKTVLGSMIEDDISLQQTIRVYDFESALLVNEVQTPDYGKDKSVYLSHAVLQEDEAFVCVGESKVDSEENDSYTEHYYLWNYTTDALNTPFTLERCNKQQLENKNKELCARLNEAYGVEVLINQANQSTLDEDEVYALKLTATPYKVYYTLTGVQAFFRVLPEGFVRETYTGMEHIETEGLRIYIAKAVVGYPNAYANRWGEYFEIALSTDGFNIDTLAHEFMHIMDARLEDRYWEENLDDVWSESNPKGFDYMGYEEADSEDWDEAVCEKYNDDFVSRYAMSAATEDRADTFSSLFTNGIYNAKEQPYWYKEGTAAAKKAVLLCGMLREAYPCLKGAPLQAWEKCIAGDLSTK